MNQQFQLYEGDCLEVMRRFDPASFHAIIADLPYGTTDCDWDTVIPLRSLWVQFKRIIKPHGAIVLFASQPFTSHLIMSNIKMYKYSWYWKKERGTGFQFAKWQPLRRIEDICVFADGATTYNPQMIALTKSYKHALPIIRSQTIQNGTIGKVSKAIGGPDGRVYKDYTHAYPHNVLSFDRDNSGSGIHPTQKPVDLIAYLIRTYTNPGETVLDCCFGSGTCGVACMETGRKFVGIEKDSHYFDVGLKRITDASRAANGQPKQLAGTESDYADAPLFAGL